MNKECRRAGRSWPAAWSALFGALLGIGVVAAGCTSGSTGESLGGGDASADVTADVTMEAASCPTGQSMCGSGCADTTKDPDNCGSCGNACTAGQVCSQGACALSCAGGTTKCGQSCVQTNTDPQNCGGCGKACGAGEACVNGACMTECPAGQKVCTGDGGSYCASLDNDSHNCGACGTACPAGEVCSGGTCGTSCQPSETLCTSDAGAGDAGAGAPYCANTQTDNANCGACGNVCPQGQVCTKGACTTSCQPNETLCTPDGGAAYCANTQSDEANCGSCGNACPAGNVCSSGKCGLSCQLGLTNCNGTCVDEKSDNANCGACGKACPAGEVCSGGTCGLTCQSGLTDCNGTCVDEQTDNANCGNCGTTCPAGQACSTGKCSLTCQSGLTNCSGTCTNPQFDPNNCGKCGTACGAGQACVSGTCKSSSGIFAQSSYAATTSFKDASSGNTTVMLAWDGTNYWAVYGGSPTGVTEAEFNAAGAVVGTFSVAIDFRSVFTLDGKGATVYGHAFNDSIVRDQTSAGVFATAVTLTGTAPNSQSSVIYDGTGSEFVAQAGGTLSRWSASTGAFIGNVTLTGFGTMNSENTFPQSRSLAIASGLYLTYSNGVLSAWSPTGARLGTTTLASAGTSFTANLTLSYANGLVWICDNNGGTWRGYDVGL